jgi:hypothetical protein
MTDAQELNLAVRQVCFAHGVSMYAILGYWNFAQQMNKCRREHHGDMLTMCAALLVAEYLARGLDLKVLEAIRSDVFNIGVPDYSSITEQVGGSILPSAV